MSASSSTTGKETNPPLRFVDSDHPEPKKKKPHKKSRGGCVSCKKRKVKCDEKIPCTNCLRRNETCQPPNTSSSPGKESTPPAPPCPFDPSGPVNLLHIELFHHFQHRSAPTLCFAEVWGPAICIAFKEEYLMTAMLATSARHLSILYPESTVYSEAAMALLSRACASFSAALDTEDGGDRHDALFFTAMLIHYLTWCNLDFLESQSEGGDRQGPGLRRDQLFLLSSGVRVFLHRTRAQGPSSVFANMSSISRCSALETIVEAQGMDRDGIVQAFVERYDEMGAAESPTPASTPQPTPDQASAEREAYRAIVSHLSVILALCKYKGSNPTPPERPDIERYVFSFPLFCVGTFLDMIVAGDARAMLVLYHFYRASMLIMGDEISWWAAGRFDAMVRVLGEELERRRVGTLIRGL